MLGDDQTQQMQVYGAAREDGRRVGKAQGILREAESDVGDAMCAQARAEARAARDQEREARTMKAQQAEAAARAKRAREGSDERVAFVAAVKSRMNEGAYGRRQEDDAGIRAPRAANAGAD